MLKLYLIWGMWKINKIKSNASRVISHMAVTTTLTIFVIADSTLKEYETITLIYNRKTCRLDLL